MAEIIAIKKRRAYIKGNMTKLQNYIIAIDNTTNAEDIKVRLSNVERYRTDFLELENKIITLDQNEELDMDFEESYYRVVAGLNLALRSKMEPVNSLNDTLPDVSMAGGHMDVKLPKISIPSFSGDYTEWQSFHDLFCSTIHDNPRLTPSQKLQYLKGTLKGEASGLLKHFSITDANYIEALKKLRDRYDRRKHTIYAFIKNFMYQPSVTTSNSTHVRRLLDTSDEIIRGLKALGEDAESRDHWLIHIMVSKLDDETGSLWAQASADFDSPTIKQFFDFLTKRIDALESIKSQNRRSHPQVTPIKPTIKSHVVSGSQVQPCSLCPAEHHRLFECSKFKGMSIEERKNQLKKDGRCFNCLNDNHNVYICKSKFRCKECNRKHHTLVHDSINVTRESSNAAQNNQPNESNSCYITNTNQECSLLPTALVHVLNGSNQKHLCRVLLDSGSQGSFITENCAQRLQLKRSNAKIAISGIGATTNGYTKGLVSLNITPWNKEKPNLQINAFVFPKLTAKQPSMANFIDLNYFNQYELADPYFYKNNEIDIIIGSDTFFEILSEGKATYNGINLQKTLLGWVVAGGSRAVPSRQSITINVGSPEDDLDKSLRKFWEIEAITSTSNHLSQEEKFCEQHFTETSVTTSNGRFEVRLPFKLSPTILGCSFRTSLQRMHSMEKRFLKDQNFASTYKDFMSEYIQLGHMKPISEDQAKINGYYLPHHGVLKSTSSTTKLRVVFDGSCKTDSGTSLNDCLAVGPTVQPTLYEILCRFRKYKTAITADVEKMYRQVRVAAEDTKYQRIIWRESSNTPFTTYELQTVTYGTASATYLATRALNEAAEKYKQQFPEAVSHIKDEMYVDDLMTGADTIEDAIKLRDEVNFILSSSGFLLRKWLSNEKGALNNINATNNQQNILEIEESSNVKVLGLHWNPRTDCFQFKVNLYDQPTLTKRGILSEASRLFDPLGWLAPATVAVKIFFQALWAENLSWDDQLPNDLAARWLKIRGNLPKIENIKLSRYLNTNTNSKLTLHGFSDASKNAYSAVVYGQIIDPNGNSVIKLLSAKTKVAPIKQVSIPRLELCGALLLTRLLSIIEKALKVEINDVVAWTDSTIVLDWLSAHPSKWNTFVGNRTGEILANMNRAQWRHVDTQDNPADCASRGIDPEKLQSFSLWWNGPKWLSNYKSWPNDTKIRSCTTEEIRIQSLTSQINKPNIILDELIEKFSSFNKIVRILAYVLRFINIKVKRLPNASPYLLSSELQKPRCLLLIHMQHKQFESEIKLIKSNQELPISSKLKYLKPFVDESGLLRVGGRLSSASITYNVKHPVILTAKEKLTELIVREHHLRYLHAGPSLMMATLRSKYWILGCRNLVRKVVHTCIKCVKYDAKVLNQVMGDLPIQRVELIRPFYKVGVDYAGPFPIHLTKGRGQKTYKGYMCIFVCLATKAVHIELASDLTTDAYIAALRRFIARRGVPNEILSDNGTNFIGARNHLNELFKFLRENTNIISNFLLTDQISFKFIPPSAPHFGGLWEAAVKSAKYHLRRVTDGHILTIEEITTLLVEVEAMLNSRPICILSSEDADYLTPAHFLIGRPTVQLPAKDLADVKITKLSRWQMIQHMNQQIWKRWSQEYLTTLQHRSKWHKKQNNVKTGDIVLIKENNIPPSKWLLGKIVELHPGSDNQIRVVTLKTSSGNMKRPIHKLCLLPVS